MNEKAKRDMPDYVFLFSRDIWAVPAHSFVALGMMAGGIRQKIVLPEIICVRKVAL